MNSILSTLTQNTLSLGKDIDQYSVKSVVVGIRYTGILLSDGSVGVAYTLLDKKTEKDSHAKYLSKKYLHERSLEEILEFSDSNLSVFRSIAVAGLNAYSQANLPNINEHSKGVTELFQSNSSITVGMIGNIHPVKSILLKKGCKLKILDNSSSPTETTQIKPVDDVQSLKDVEHIIVSGSALVFDTFSNIIELLSHLEGEKILLGPSAQILPDIAFSMGFTYLGSSKITNGESVLTSIMEGGGYRAFKEYTKKYSFQASLAE